MEESLKCKLEEVQQKINDENGDMLSNHDFHSSLRKVSKRKSHLADPNYYRSKRKKSD